MASTTLHDLSTYVMAGHSRPKDGVASLAYVPAIHALLFRKGVDARHKAGHDELYFLRFATRSLMFGISFSALSPCTSALALGSSTSTAWT